MKLIIDIPEEIYIEKKEDYIGDTLDRAIANGTPLEDIKAEIENIDLVYEKHGRTTIMKNFDDIKSDIFDILDKHIKENKQ